MNVYDTGFFWSFIYFTYECLLHRFQLKFFSTEIKSYISFQIVSQAGQWKSTSPLLEVPSVCSWTQLCLVLDQTVETLSLSLLRFFKYRKLLQISIYNFCLLSSTLSIAGARWTYHQSSKTGDDTPSDKNQPSNSQRHLLGVFSISDRCLHQAPREGRRRKGCGGGRGGKKKKCGKKSKNAEEGLLLSSSHGLVTGDTWRCRTDDGSNFLPPIRFCLPFFLFS